MAPPPEPPVPGRTPTDPMVPCIARVRRRRRDAPQVWTLDLEVDDGNGTENFAFAPGQFNMLTVFGVGEVPISLSGDPAKPGCLVHTVRAVGAVSGALARLGPGDPVGLRGPFGAGWPMTEAAGRDVVIVAGGLGLAPLRPALYQLLAGRARYGKIVLLYGARSPDDILFRREIEVLAAGARYRNRSDSGPCHLRMAWPCWRRDHADFPRRLRSAACHCPGLWAGGHDALRHRRFASFGAR